MANGLQGKRVVLAASRKTEEMITLIEKQGGEGVVRSLQGTVFLADKEVEPELRKVITEGADWLIFTTGIGTEALLNVAKNSGNEEGFLTLVKKAKIASRGYKTVAALKKIDVVPDVKDDDGTTEGLMRELQAVDFKGKTVMVQLHGIRSPRLTSFLEEKGAHVIEILPYQHIAPEESTVSLLCKELVDGAFDAVCFTTAIQVHSLFTYAKKENIDSELLAAFREKVVAVAVGKVTAEVLKEEGLERFVAPEIERMGAMMVELARYYDKNE